MEAIVDGTFFIICKIKSQLKLKKININNFINEEDFYRLEKNANNNLIKEINVANNNIINTNNKFKLFNINKDNNNINFENVDDVSKFMVFSPEQVKNMEVKELEARLKEGFSKFMEIDEIKKKT